MVTRTTAAERRETKKRELLAQGRPLSGASKSNEPMLNPLDYKVSLLKALNYYNAAYDDREKRKWVMAYVGKENQSKYSELPDYRFHTVGAVIRLIQRGQAVDDKDLQIVVDELAELAELNKRIAAEKKEKAEDKPKTVKVVRDHNVELLSEVLGVIDAAIDDYVTDRKEPDFSVILRSRAVPAAVAKLIPAKYDHTVEEVREALEGNDPQLVEGYSFFKKSELKKFLKILESLEPACNQQVVTVKAAKPVRIRKEKPAAQITAKVKYQKDCPEFGVKSVHPSKLHGAMEAWIFNTKYRTLQVYRATDTLTVKGTTIVGYDVAKSSCKKLRKPEVVKELSDMTRINIGRAYDALKTAVQAVNGRVNENCIILKVFP